MHKSDLKTKQALSNDRVLARFLAEDLRVVCANDGNSHIGNATSSGTSPLDDPNGRKDITNVGGDGDLA